MAAKKSSEKSAGRRPATTPEGRENQLVGLAVDLAEQQLREGTASSQVISHFLKLGSSREALEKERLRGENELIRAKVESLESQRRFEEVTEEALKAMRSYQGIEEEYDVDEDGYERY